MPNKKGIAYYKDWLIAAGFLISFGTILIGWSNSRTKRALTDDQVVRNTKAIEEADLKVVSHRLDEIDKKVDLIYEILINE